MGVQRILDILRDFYWFQKEDTPAFLLALAAPSTSTQPNATAKRPSVKEIKGTTQPHDTTVANHKRDVLIDEMFFSLVRTSPLIIGDYF